MNMNEPTDLDILSTPGFTENPVIIEVEKQQENNDLMQLFLAFPIACLSICLGLSILTASVFATGAFLLVVDCSATNFVCKK